MHILANSEGSDEIQYHAQRKKNIQYYLGIITCDPLIYTMDHPKIIVSNRRKNPLVHKGSILINMAHSFSGQLSCMIWILRLMFF